MPLRLRPQADHRRLPRGPAHPHWRDGEVEPDVGRRRAQSLYVLDVCEQDGCTKPAVDRHHVDGDTTNNALSNVRGLCRRHHMVEDGRLERLIEAGQHRTLPEPHRCSCGKRIARRQEHCWPCYREQRQRPARLRVQEMLGLRSAGLSDEQIAERLGDRVKTVQNLLGPKAVARLGLTWVPRGAG